MGYKLVRGESLSYALKRIASEQIDHALTVLGGPVSRRAEAAHTARKHIKKARSLLRLVRKDVGERVYRPENTALGEVADILAGARSATALVETFDILVKHYACEINATAFRPIRRALVADRRNALRRLTSNAVLAATDGLADVRGRIDSWSIDDEFTTIEAGLRRSVKDGRASLAAAYRDLDSTAFHELRKSAKDLLYQSHIIRPLWPTLLKRFEREVEHLTDHLGEEHDYAALTTWLADHAEEFATSCEIGAVFGLADQRRLEARTAAHALATRIYAERPTAYVRRIRAYWNAYSQGLAGDVVGVVRANSSDAVGEALVVR